MREDLGTGRQVDRVAVGDELQLVADGDHHRDTRAVELGGDECADATISSGSPRTIPAGPVPRGSPRRAPWRWTRIRAPTASRGSDPRRTGRAADGSPRRSSRSRDRGRPRAEGLVEDERRSVRLARHEDAAVHPAPHRGRRARRGPPPRTQSSRLSATRTPRFVGAYHAHLPVGHHRTAAVGQDGREVRARVRHDGHAESASSSATGPAAASWSRPVFT